MEKNWCMIRKSGSIGEHTNARYGSSPCNVVQSDMTEEEAKEMAKRWRKMLTPGEKKYYHINYSAVLMSKVKSL